jgi:hypothetical protein
VADFEVTGLDGLLAFSKGLKNAGERGLRNELNKRLRETAKPLIQQTREAARRELPKRGGLAEQVASTPQRIKVATGRDPGVFILVSKRAGVRATNRGLLRHPVYGNREVWVDQKVAAGWFDATLDTGVVFVRKAIDDALQTMFDEIAREAA